MTEKKIFLLDLLWTGKFWNLYAQPLVDILLATYETRVRMLRFSPFLLHSDFLFLSLIRATSAQFSEFRRFFSYVFLRSVDDACDCVSVTFPLSGSLSFSSHPSDVVRTQKLYGSCVLHTLDQLRPLDHPGQKACHSRAALDAERANGRKVLMFVTRRCVRRKRTFESSSFSIFKDPDHALSLCGNSSAASRQLCPIEMSWALVINYFKVLGKLSRENEHKFKSIFLFPIWWRQTLLLSLSCRPKYFFVKKFNYFHRKSNK